MGGFFGGILQGTAKALQDTQGQIREDEARQSDLERRTFEALLRSEDPEVQRLAFAGLLKSASGVKGKTRTKGLRGFLGETQASDEYKAIQAHADSLGSEPGSPPPPAVGSGINYGPGAPPPATDVAAPGAAAMPAQSAVQQVTPGTPNVPVDAAAVQPQPGPGAAPGAAPPSIPGSDAGALPQPPGVPAPTMAMQSFAQSFGGRTRAGQPISWETPYEEIKPRPGSFMGLPNRATAKWDKEAEYYEEQKNKARFKALDPKDEQEAAEFEAVRKAYQVGIQNLDKLDPVTRGLATGQLIKQGILPKPADQEKETARRAYEEARDARKEAFQQAQQSRWISATLQAATMRDVGTATRFVITQQEQDERAISALAEGEKKQLDKDLLLDPKERAARVASIEADKKAALATSKEKWKSVPLPTGSSPGQAPPRVPGKRFKGTVGGALVEEE